jgi:fibronectin type 3 domain-containing protein
MSIFRWFNTPKYSLPRRTFQFESLEKRELMDAALASHLTTFNQGLDSFREKSDQVAAAAWGSDVVDIPLLKATLDRSLELGSVIRNLTPSNISVTESLDAALADLAAHGFVVDYLSSTPNAAGNFLEVRRITGQQNIALSPMTVGGSEGFEYLNQGVGELAGTITGELKNLTGMFRFVVDASGFKIGADSQLTAKIAAQGNLKGAYDIGVLDDIRFKGNASFSGNLNLKFRDQDGDRELSLNEVTRNSNAIGKLNGKIGLNGEFRTDLPGLSQVKWSGKFDAQVRDKRLRTTQDFVLPNYNEIAKSARLGLIAELKNADWFAKIEPYFDKEIPYIDKSIGEMLGIDSDIGSGIAIAGVQLLPPNDAKMAMRNFIDGKNIDLIKFELEKDIKLSSKEFIKPFEIGRVDFIPGVASGVLEAFLSGSVMLSIDIYAGVDTSGVYLDPKTRLGIDGYVEGGVKGTLKVFGYDLAEAKGSLQLDAGIGVQPLDRQGDGRVHITEFQGELEDNLISTITVDLSAKVKAQINIVKIDIFGYERDIHITILDEDFHIANLVNEQIIGTSRTTVARNMVRGPQNPDALVPPTNVRVISSSAEQVRLQWDKQPRAKGYAVIGSVDNGKTWQALSKLISPADSQASVTVSADTNYKFQVVAVYDDDFGALSDSVELKTHNGKLPAPQNLRVVATGPTEVEVRWDEMVGEDKYTIQVSTNKGNSWSKQEDVPADHAYSAKLTVQPGQTYWFRIVAWNRYGAGNPSDFVEIKTPDGKLPAPTNLRAVTIGPREVEVRWNEVVGETHYQVQRSTDGQSNWQKQEDVPADHAYSAKLTVVPGQKYFFRVVAINQFGAGASSNILEVIVPTGIPEQVTDLRLVSATPREVEVRWSEVNGETHYQIQRSTDGQSNWQKQEDVPADHAYSAKITVEPGRNYWLRVVAFNEFGASKASNAILVSTPDGRTAAPTHLRVVSTSPREIEVAWNEVSGEDYYRVLVSQDGGNSWNQQENVPADHAHSAKLTVAPDRDYWFKVVAVNSYGTSDASNVVQVRSKGEPPAAPDNLRLVAKRTNEVEVKWSEVSGEDKYTVQVSTDNGKTWKKQEDVPADHAYSARLSVTKGRTYWFRVIAVNEFGASMASNVLKVDL